MHADDGTFWLAYRLRRPVDQGRGFANVARPLVRRRALRDRRDGDQRRSSTAPRSNVRRSCRSTDGGFRLYVSCSTWNSKHWWVEAVDIDCRRHASARARWCCPATPPPRGRTSSCTAPATEWQMWACRHPLDDGDDEADRMTTWYATSADGLDWQWQGAALAPTPGTVGRARHADRERAAASTAAGWRSTTAARAPQENWHERTGVAFGDRPGRRSRPTDRRRRPGRRCATSASPNCRDGYRLYWEASRVDGAHDLRTAYVPRPESLSQS